MPKGIEDGQVQTVGKDVQVPQAMGQRDEWQVFVPQDPTGDKVVQAPQVTVQEVIVEVPGIEI